MLAVHEHEKIESKKVSIRYDKSTETYYCFYHQITNSLSDVILSYEVKDSQWIVDTMEYKNLFEDKLNQLFKEKNLPFEEQVRYVIDYLDGYFAEQCQQQKIQGNVINHRTHSLGWFRRFRGVRRWASQDIPTTQTPVLQRYSAPAKSTRIDDHDQIISVKSLAESFYTDEIKRSRTKTFASPLEYSKQTIPIHMPSKAPPIAEIWLNVLTQEMSDFPKKLGNHIGEDKLKKLADKFVTYFSGTFQCNVGRQYQLVYDNQTWHFTVLKVEFLPNEITKLPKTKIIFLIKGIPHYVRG